MAEERGHSSADPAQPASTATSGRTALSQLKYEEDMLDEEEKGCGKRNDLNNVYGVRISQRCDTLQSEHCSQQGYKAKCDTGPGC